MLEDILKNWGGVEVGAMEVYSDMFNLGYNEIQKAGEESGVYKSNPIGYWKNGKSKGHYRIMFDDTFEDTLKELQEADFSILNGITYFGRKNLQEHASKMYALIFDLDGVTDTTLNAFMSASVAANLYPMPNYIALSGHGIHLYYIFEYGIPLYPNIKIQLKAFKYALTEKIWNQYTSKEKKKQFQGINQGFRVIGGKSKVEGVRVRAFRMNEHPFNLEQLGEYIPEENRVDESKLWKESKMTLAEAKKMYPEWYQEKVVEKQGRKYWECNTALYEWWKRKIREGATFHHRYFSIMCLVIYGVKCGLSYDEVERDAFSLIPFLNAINPDEPFTKEDCMSALECYDSRYCTFPLDDIVKISGIPVEKNKRNGRKQSVHVKYMNNQRAFKFEIGECTNGGRPSKKGVILEYVRNNRENINVSKIARACGVSRGTVYKYWDDIIAEANPSWIPIDYVEGDAGGFYRGVENEND